MNLQLLPSDIEAYLKEVKKSILSGHYAIARNRNRSENEQLFLIMYCLSPRPGKFCSV